MKEEFAKSRDESLARGREATEAQHATLRVRTMRQRSTHMAPLRALLCQLAPCAPLATAVARAGSPAYDRAHPDANPGPRGNVQWGAQARQGLPAKGAWSDTFVFVGNSSGYLNSEQGVPGTWQSPNGHDKKIVARFGPSRAAGAPRFFVDISSDSHSITDSHTLTLERDFGWHGLCVLRQPSRWWQFSHRACSVVGASLAPTTREPGSITTRRGSRALCMHGLQLQIHVPPYLPHCELVVQNARTPPHTPHVRA